MTRQTFNLSGPGGEGWRGAAPIDRGLIAGDATAYLRHIRRIGNGIQVQLAAAAAGTPYDTGPEFTEALETADRAFTFAAGGSTLVLKGPNHADLAGHRTAIPDPSEPYYWIPDNAADMAAWFGAAHGDFTLTLDDGIDAPHVRGIASAGAPETAGRIVRIVPAIRAVRGMAAAGASEAAGGIVRIVPAVHTVRGGAAAGPAAVAGRVSRLPLRPVRGIASSGPAEVGGRVQLRVPLSATFRIPASMALALRAPPGPHAAGLRWRRTVRSLVAERGLLAAAAISHPNAPEPIRIVSASRERVLGGLTWLGVPFTWRLAADEPDRGPRTQIAIPWTGREMAELLEAAEGGVGAAVELSEWSFDPDLPEIPAEPEWRLRFHVTGSRVVPLQDAEPVAGQLPQLLVLDLGVTPRADRPAVSARFAPESDPWAFA